MKVTIAAVGVERFAPRFEIEVNNARLAADVTNTIRRVEVTQALNQTLNFNFHVQDAFAGGGFRWLGDSGEVTQEIFKFGNNTSILLGYSSQLVKMCEGQIQNITATFDQGLAPSFTVEGSDAAYSFLTTPTEVWPFSEMSASAIVRVIAEKAGMRAILDDSEVVFPRKMKKGGENAMKFLEDLAKDAGFEFRLSGRELYFVKPKITDAPIGTLTWGRELINFRPRLKASVPTEVTVSAWDRSGRRRIRETVRAGDERQQEPGRQLGSQVASEIYGGVVKVISDRPVRSPREARKIAQAALEESTGEFITASGETVGLTELVPGVSIILEGLGKWFSGKYYLDKVAHSIGDGGFRSTFEARRGAI